MASAAEQLASNLSLSAFSKATELKQRILFTLGALIIYRLGTYIPLPGIDPTVFAQAFSQNSAGILGLFNMFAGGALERMAIFALGVMPYITASIVIQVLTIISKDLEAMKKEGETGRKKLNQYTRYLAVVLAALQAFGMAVGLESSASGGGQSLVIDPGAFFRISTVITITASTMFLLWLGEQITSRGVGNGTSLIIFSGIVAGLPGALYNTFELSRTGALSGVLVVGLMFMILCVIAFIVFIERAQRRLVVQYPKRQVGMKMFGGDSTHLPLKINSANVIPPIFASSILLMPASVLGFMASGNDVPPWLQTTSAMLQHGQPLFMALYAFMIIFFCFFYTAIVVNPDDTAENLKKAGGFIPGIRPGKNTAEYIDYVLTRLTVLGASYLTIICLLPEFIISQHPGVPFYLGGTSLLIAVSVTIDTISQIHAHLLAHQYEGLIKKAKLRGAKR